MTSILDRKWKPTHCFIELYSKLPDDLKIILFFVSMFEQYSLQYSLHYSIHSKQIDKPFHIN